MAMTMLARSAATFSKAERASLRDATPSIVAAAALACVGAAVYAGHKRAQLHMLAATVSRSKPYLVELANQSRPTIRVARLRKGTKTPEASRFTTPSTSSK